jgi:DNA-binding MarR family transcriptional regulator
MPLNTVTSEGAFRAFMVVELLRSTGEKEFPAQLMSIFLWIASHNGCKQEDLIKDCNIKRSSVSRCVTWLGPSHRLEHRSGLKLVRRERDPDNWRAYRLYLTPKGDIFVNLLDNYAKASLSHLTKAKQEVQDLDNHDSEDLGGSPRLHVESEVETADKR